MMQLDELMKTAYSVFPKEVSDRSENYKETSEHKRLLKHLELKETYSEYLNMLADNLIKLFPTYQFENQSNLISYDRCVRGRFINKSLNTHLVSVYISLVIPSYIILQMPLEIKFNSIQEMNSGKLFEKYLHKNKQPLIVEIEKELKKYFKAHNTFDINYLDINVPNIVFDGNGQLATFTPSDNLNSMTLFNVFFTNNYILA